MMGAAITAVGAALPERVVANAELERDLQLPADWIEERTGIVSRHVVGPGESLPSLATEACTQALAMFGTDPADIDAVVIATCTADRQIPATAPLVQTALGCGPGPAFDINAGCSGFLYASAAATALVENGTCERVLLCGVDIMSRIVDPADARSCVLFGDGAGAVIIERSPEHALGPFELYADGSRPELLHVAADTGYLVMDGKQVFRHAVDGMVRAVRSICERAGASLDDIDLVVGHQANARILSAVAERLGLRPEQALIDIALVGNTSAASIPIALSNAQASGRLHAGDHIVLTAFGAGFTWGAGLATWVCAPPATEAIDLEREAVHA